MRLQKALTNAGVASRRQVETMIQEGHIEVNGETILHPAYEIEEGDAITIDGEPLPKPQRLVYYAYHKPKGLITTRNDPEHRPTIFDKLPEMPARVESVGRLDFQTSGILLLTNDGDLANKLTHPKMNVPKKYMVKVWKAPTERKLDLLRKGIVLDDGKTKSKTKPAKLRIVDTTDTNNVWIEVLVTEGRNRLIRRLFETIGHPVSKLKRISFATIGLGELEVGQIRLLSGDEVRRLQEIAEGTDAQKAGNDTKYKKGFAKPKPKNNHKPKRHKKKIPVRTPTKKTDSSVLQNRKPKKTTTTKKESTNSSGSKPSRSVSTNNQRTERSVDATAKRTNAHTTKERSKPSTSKMPSRVPKKSTTTSKSITKSTKR